MIKVGLHKALTAAVIGAAVTLAGCNDGTSTSTAQSSAAQTSTPAATNTSSSSGSTSSNSGTSASSGSTNPNGSQGTSGSGSNPASALTLSGAPPSTAVVDALYSFQPSVPRSSTLVIFHAAGLPGWLKLDSTTGAISGTPGPSDVGSTGHITITASNDTSTASLTPFSVQVVAAGGKGTMVVSWTPPTKNSDGSPITDLAGYTINYGTDPHELSRSIKVAGAGMNAFEITGLVPGTIYYFSVTAYNSAGMDSGDSNHIDQTTS